MKKAVKKATVKKTVAKKFIVFLATEAEARRINKAAAAKGLNRSDYLRLLVREAAA